jgi:hypothetical protein
MKGFIETTFMTQVILVAVLVALVGIGLLLICMMFDVCPLGPGQVVYAVNHLNIMNTPHNVASILSEKEFEAGGEKKLFTDHVQEAFLTDVDENKQRELGENVGEFLDKFNLDYYEITLQKEGRQQSILQVGNSIQKCGVNLQDSCIERIGGGSTGSLYVGECNVGRVPVPDNGVCKSGWSCCQEDHSAYRNKYNSELIVVDCGPGNIGICSARDPSRGSCMKGSISLENYNSDCSLVNEGKTPICCTTDPDALRNQNKIADAKIPFFYQDKTSYLVVTTGD